ncbi:beta-alanine transporter-like isoform X2 [Centruroides vittatus]|uniref:beta-alanine transporter-like isoform X2 n=1 Tax=Centruroides vittatus TaxID=120091 RepID=UPI00350EAB48
MDYNVALQKVGDFGLFQKLLCGVLVIPSAAFCALVYFTQFFIILVPEHWCYVPQDVLWNQSMPDDEQLRRCYMYDVSSSSFIDKLSDQSNKTLIPCQYGWTYDFSQLYPTIATELNWVCDNERLPYTAQTIFYIGTCLGSIVLGLIADRYGRKPSIICSYVLAFGAGLISAFTTNFYMFVILRFLVGASIIPLSEDPYVLSLEYIGLEKRTLSVIFWISSYITFSAICPWIAYAISDWKKLCIATSVPLLLIVLGGIWLPESASWLLTQGRYKEAIQLLKKVAKINGKEFPEEYEHIYDEENLENACQKQHTSESNVNFFDLFRTSQLRKNSLLQAIMWFSIYSCYHTNTQNASNLGTDIYESFTFGALVEIPSMLIVLFGIDKIGRRWPIIIMSILAGIAGIITFTIPAAELCPTVLRGRGLAFLRLMGTLGLFLSPSVVYLGLSYYSLPLIISGGVMLLVVIYAIFLPETLGQHLPHSIEDGENFGKDQNIFDCPCIAPKLEDSKEKSESSLPQAV